MRSNNMSYKTSEKSQYLDIVNIKALERQFQNSMKKENHSAEADFILGGAGGEETLRANTDDFRNFKIIPSVMHGLFDGLANTSTSFLGQKLTLPIIVSPSAAHGLVHENAEQETIRGVAESGSIMTVSHFSNQLISSIHDSSPETPWLYHYDEDSDPGMNRFLLDTAVRNKAKAIVIGVFGASFGRRERDLTNKFDFPSDLPFQQLSAYTDYPKGLDIRSVNNRKHSDITTDRIKVIKKYSKLPVIIKGVQNGIDAVRAIEAGADAVWISNTGGRQLDGTRSTIDALPEISRAVNKRVPIIFDSGVRNGQHVFKALALGANLVALGRPILYGLHMGGSKGVESVMRHMQGELENTMLLSGVKNLEELHKYARVERKH